MENIAVSPYHSSFLKRCLDLSLSLVGLIIVSPLFLLIILSIAVASGFPVFYTQIRRGKNRKRFRIFKFRTMVNNASSLQKRYSRVNEADGPVFKIYNDPRFTGFGRILSRTGLDELPQLLNVLKGEMSLVGPRPLPLNEEAQLSAKYKLRSLIRPGITSPWVVYGAHRLSFSKWMELDLQYVKFSNALTDLKIILQTPKTFSPISTSRHHSNP